MLDLPAYLHRIAFEGDLTPDRALLDALHLAHASQIPFENLDILLGRPIRVDLESIQNKLIHERRGGYCFEHNLMMAAVLETLGFAVTKLAARVRIGSTQMRARTHMLLMVEMGEQPLLVDVGFGAQGFQHPLPFVPGKVFRRFRWVYRVATEEGGWVLQSRAKDTWIDLYAFTLEPQHWIDYKVANHYVSTHPDSQFARGLIVQRPTPQARYSLYNMEFSIDRGDTTTTRSLRDQTELHTILAETFDLPFARDVRFPIPPS
jgi:N-hydroxyarylamine O-acetyltransferase